MLSKFFYNKPFRIGQFFWVFLFIFSFLGKNIANDVEIPSSEKLDAMPIVELFSLASAVSASDFEASKRIIDLTFVKAKKGGKIEEIVDCYRSLGYIYEDHGDYNKACDEYLSALSIGETTNAQRISLLNDIAISYRKARNYQKSKEYHLKTLDFARSCNDLSGVEFAFDGLGTLYYIAGDYDKAANYYLQSLSYSEKRNSPMSMIITYKNLTEIYTAAKHFDLALQSAEKAYQLADKQKDKDAYTKVMICYANTLCEKGRYDDAINKIKESLKLLESEPKLISTKQSAIMSLGDIYFKQQNFVAAEEAYRICLKDKDNLSNLNLAKLYIDLGDIYIQRKDTKNAEFYYTEGLKISNQFTFLPLVQKAHSGLYELFRNKSDVPNALMHLELANKLRDSLNSDEKMARVAELQFRYDLERSESEIQELKFRESKVTLYGGLGITSLIILLLGYIVWMRGENNKSLIVKNKEIGQQNKRLAESNEVLRQFAYASAHDLKEPLRNIGSFVTLIQRKFSKDLPEECNEYMGYVTSGVRKMNNLLEDLLEYSTLIINNEAAKESADLHEVVKEIKQNLFTTIQNKGATIVCFDHFPKVGMSKLHTTQLLQNLISNAIKFVNGKSPIIKIESSLTANNKVLVTVQDNGIGINKEFSEKVFHLFHRLHKNDNQYEGTGVGLAICKNIVEKYNGKIWFESEENVGTKFFIELPNIS